MPFPNVRGLKLPEGIVSFEFKPTVGILARDMDKFGMDIRSFREPLTRAVKEVMIPSIRKNFDAQGRPKWTPLAEDTLLLRNRLGTGDTILNSSGALKKTMGYQNIWSITGEYAIIKDLPDSVWYGKVHQDGISGMKTRLRNEVKAAAAKGTKITAGEAAKRAMKSIDKEIKSGNAKHSRTNIPARPFVMFQGDDFDAIEAVFQKWLGERARAAGWKGL